MSGKRNRDRKKTAAQRRRRRLARRTSVRFAPDPTASTIGIVRGPDGQTLELTHYEITFDAMPDARVEALPADVRAYVTSLPDELPEHSERHIPRLEQLIERYPDMPKLYNYLSAAYEAAGRRDEAFALTRITYELFPDYLFAKCNFARLCMLEGEVERVPEILGGKFALHQHVPDRNLFHITEVLVFFTVVAEYQIRTGDRDQALRTYDMLCQLDVEHPQLDHLASLLWWDAMRHRLFGWLSRRAPASVGV